MYLILAKKEKGDSFSSIFVLINWYLRSLGKRDYILAYPGYTSIWGKTPSKSSHLRDNLFVIPGNDNHGLITHMMNTSQCSAMDQAVNNPQKRYSFLDHLYRKKPDHSKMLVFFDDEDGTTKKYFDYFLNCACSWKIPVPNWKAKALVLGSSNMSDTTYIGNLVTLLKGTWTGLIMIPCLADSLPQEALTSVMAMTRFQACSEILLFANDSSLDSMTT